jgi:hypothetical protein
MLGDVTTVKVSHPYVDVVNRHVDLSYQKKKALVQSKGTSAVKRQCSG